MQVSFRKVLLSSVALMALSASAVAEVKVGVVDFARVFSESPQAKTMQEALQSEFEPRRQQLITQDQSFKTRSEKLQKDAATMSPDQRAKAEKELSETARDLQRKRNEWQEEWNARRQEEMNKVQTALINEVQKYAKAQSYDLVIAEGVLFASPAVDITGAVLQALQARGGAARPAAPAGGAPAPAKPAAKP